MRGVSPVKFPRGFPVFTPGIIPWLIARLLVVFATSIDIGLGTCQGLHVEKVQFFILRNSIIDFFSLCLSLIFIFCCERMLHFQD